MSAPSWPQVPMWPQSPMNADVKGSGKGYFPSQQQLAPLPPPPPPMLLGHAPPVGPPWMQQNMPMMHHMPAMQPSPETTFAGQPPMTVMPNIAPTEDQAFGRKVQQKLNKIVKAAKKEEHLSAEFQNLVHAEMKKDNKECSRNLHTAVTALDKAKEAQLEVENARLQLWAQWRVFLQQSVVKWKEYTAQFQAAETAFQQQAQEAHLNLKRAQKHLDIAKRRMDAGDKDETYTVSSEEETEEMDAKEESELGRDENAQKIQEGLHQVVSSLEVLSESAEKLEPKAKRPRNAEEEGGAGQRSYPSLEPFGKAGDA